MAMTGLKSEVESKADLVAEVKEEIARRRQRQRLSL